MAPADEKVWRQYPLDNMLSKTHLHSEFPFRTTRDQIYASPCLGAPPSANAVLPASEIVFLEGLRESVAPSGPAGFWGRVSAGRCLDMS